MKTPGRKRSQNLKYLWRELYQYVDVIGADLDQQNGGWQRCEVLLGCVALVDSEQQIEVMFGGQTEQGAVLYATPTHEQRSEDFMAD